MPKHLDGKKGYGYVGLYWMQHFGASMEDMDNISAQIGHLESSNQNLDHQLVNDGLGGTRKIYNQGKGYFQFTVGKKKGFKTALQRYKNLVTGDFSKGKFVPRVPKWVTDAQEHGDPSKLERWQQEELMFADLAMKPGSDDAIKEALRTDDTKELWLDHWWSGKDEDRPEKVENFNKNIGDSTKTYHVDSMAIKMKDMEGLKSPNPREY